MKNNIKKLMKENKSFINYLLISVFVTIIDIITSRICEQVIPVIYANSVGIVAGFIIQYLMTTRYVYNKKNIGVFIKFLITFIIGFVLANLIVYVCRIIIFDNSTGFIPFAIGKGTSIVLPFFVMYFIRKKWIEEK